MVIQLGPFPRATVKRVSIAISQLELDVLVISFYRFRTDSELVRDPGSPETGANQGKDMQLTIGQIRYLETCCPAVDNLVNSAQSEPRANVKLTCEDSINGTDQLFPGTGLHPIPRGARAQRTFCINLFRLSRYSENPAARKTGSKLFEKKNSVVMAKEWFNDKQIWVMLFRQLMHRPFISCEPAHWVAQIVPDNRGESFSGDCAVVSNNYRRLSRGERGGRGSHKF